MQMRMTVLTLVAVLVEGRRRPRDDRRGTYAYRRSVPNCGRDRDRHEPDYGRGLEQLKDVYSFGPLV